MQLLDHHQSAWHLNAYDWAHISAEEEGTPASAASLLYEFLLSRKLLEPSQAITEFVELIRQYDTWEWEKNDNQAAKRLNAFFFLVSIDEFEERMISRLTTQEHFFFDDFEQSLLDMEEKKIERYIRRKRRELIQASVGEHLADIVYAESYHSELGNELGKECPYLDYIVD